MRWLFVLSRHHQKLPWRNFKKSLACRRVVTICIVVPKSQQHWPFFFLCQVCCCAPPLLVLPVLENCHFFVAPPKVFPQQVCSNRTVFTMPRLAHTKKTQSKAMNTCFLYSSARVCVCMCSHFLPCQRKNKCPNVLVIQNKKAAVK